MARGSKRKSQRVLIDRDLAEAVRLRREYSAKEMSDKDISFHLGRGGGWVASWKAKDDGFREQLREAADHVRPTKDWQSMFLQELRRGSSRKESLRLVKEKYTELRPADVELEVKESREFAKAMEDIEIEDRWEAEDALKRRAKKNASDARLYLGTKGGSGGGRLAKGDNAAPAAAEVGEAGWVNAERESEEAEWLESKPYGKKRLTDGEGMRVLSDPRPSGGAG